LGPYTANSKTLWQTRVFGLRTSFRNINRDEEILEDGNRNQFGARSDLSFQPHSGHQLETGVYVRRLGIDSLSHRFFSTGSLFDSLRFRNSGNEVAFFAQTPGPANNEEYHSPEEPGLSTVALHIKHLFLLRIALGWSVTEQWKVRAGAGRYYQFPDLEQMFGRLGNPILRAERATHYTRQR
jgi:outer membrane receptor protein involved in Fe transport